MSSSTSNTYIKIPPASPPASLKLSPPPPKGPWVPSVRFISYYGLFVIIWIVFLFLVGNKVPDQWHHYLTVESLSPSSSSSAGAAAWDVSFSVSNTTTYDNRTMKATLFRGNASVSDSTMLGPIVDATATTATFSIANATVLEARYLTPCLAVSNLTVKLELEEPVPFTKTSRSLVVVCENVVVLLSSNGSSCYSSSPPALVGRAPCRNDGIDLQRILEFTSFPTAAFVTGLIMLILQRIPSPEI